MTRKKTLESVDQGMDNYSQNKSLIRLYEH